MWVKKPAENELEVPGAPPYTGALGEGDAGEVHVSADEGQPISEAMEHDLAEAVPRAVCTSCRGEGALELSVSEVQCWACDGTGWTAGGVEASAVDERAWAGLPDWTPEGEVEGGGEDALVDEDDDVCASWWAGSDGQMNSGVVSDPLESDPGGELEPTMDGTTMGTNWALAPASVLGVSWDGEDEVTVGRSDSADMNESEDGELTLSAVLGRAWGLDSTEEFVDAGGEVGEDESEGVEGDGVSGESGSYLEGESGGEVGPL